MKVAKLFIEESIDPYLKTAYLSSSNSILFRLGARYHSAAIFCQLNEKYNDHIAPRGQVTRFHSYLPCFDPFHTIFHLIILYKSIHCQRTHKAL